MCGDSITDTNKNGWKGEKKGDNGWNLVITEYGWKQGGREEPLVRFSHRVAMSASLFVCKTSSSGGRGDFWLKGASLILGCNDTIFFLMIFCIIQLIRIFGASLLWIMGELSLPLSTPPPCTYLIWYNISFLRTLQLIDWIAWGDNAVKTQNINKRDVKEMNQY